MRSSSAKSERGRDFERCPIVPDWSAVFMVRLRVGSGCEIEPTGEPNSLDYVENYDRTPSDLR
jgi:hypothetical protein